MLAKINKETEVISIITQPRSLAGHLGSAHKSVNVKNMTSKDFHNYIKNICVQINIPEKRKR